MSPEPRPEEDADEERDSWYELDEDHRLDDPRHGQAEAINRTPPTRH